MNRSCEIRLSTKSQRRGCGRLLGKRLKWSVHLRCACAGLVLVLTDGFRSATGVPPATLRRWAYEIHSTFLMPDAVCTRRTHTRRTVSLSLPDSLPLSTHIYSCSLSLLHSASFSSSAPLSLFLCALSFPLPPTEGLITLAIHEGVKSVKCDKAVTPCFSLALPLLAPTLTLFLSFSPLNLHSLSLSLSSWFYAALAFASFWITLRFQSLSYFIPPVWYSLSFSPTLLSLTYTLSYMIFNLIAILFYWISHKICSNSSIAGAPTERRRRKYG